MTLAYATTIHKAQGSEYPTVAIPVAMTHYMMLRRNLIDTGIMRGKRLVVLDKGPTAPLPSHAPKIIQACTASSGQCTFNTVPSALFSRFA